MAQQHQWHSRYGSETAWLSQLVKSFDEVARDDVHTTPCDAATIRAAKAQLSRPQNLVEAAPCN